VFICAYSANSPLPASAFISSVDFSQRPCFFQGVLVLPFAPSYFSSTSCTREAKAGSSVVQLFNASQNHKHFPSEKTKKQSRKKTSKRKMRTTSD
jgi:hypothetical protein